jgi:hypothetical protein
MDGAELMRLVLLYLHLIGYALLLGALVVQTATGRLRIDVTMRTGLGTVIATGLLLALPFLHEQTPNYTKLGLKFAVVVVIGALFGFGVTRQRAGREIHRWHFLTIGGLVLLNAAVAVFWR